MKSLRVVFWLLFFCGWINCPAQGLIGKLKQKAGQVADKALDKKVKEKTGVDGGEGDSGSSGNTGSNSNHPSNKGGGGLVTAPPNVNENLNDAESAFKSSNYGDARYAVQQAMLGVEMEIGNKVLKSLPESVSGLPKVADRDQVTSTSWGWVGLTIQREYMKGDQELRTLITNNSALMSAIGMYLSSGAYAQQTNGEQNWKQTKVKTYKAIIEYSESSGYKLSVPIGQTSLIVWEGVNFSSEQDMMAAANSFDIDGIKKMLGEQ